MSERELRFELVAEDGAPDKARDAVAGSGALSSVDDGARLTVSLLARSLVARCVRGQGGLVRVGVSVDAECVRVEVSGDGPAFSIPVSERWVDYLSLDDAAPQPIGWGAYLLERLADRWGIDADRGVAWFEVDHASADARRLNTRRRVAVASPVGSAR